MLSSLHQLCFRSFSCPNRLIFKPIFRRLLAYSSRINLSFTTQVLVHQMVQQTVHQALKLVALLIIPVYILCSIIVLLVFHLLLNLVCLLQSVNQSHKIFPSNHKILHYCNLIIHFSQLLLHLQNHFLNVYLLLSLLFQLMSCILVQNLVFSKQKLILPPFLYVNQILWSHHL